MKQYTLKEVADILGIKIRTLRGWLYRNKINAKRHEISGRVYIDEIELQRLKNM